MSLNSKNNEKINTSSVANIKCYFCGENHACRNCPKELAMAPIFKKKVGNMMEYWVANNFNCPECGQKSLKVIGNHTPSLDIICDHCNNKFEVKSKCLSVSKLPTDIKLPHGSYIDYVHRLNDGLNLIVIIYGVDRVKKMINIREVVYADNNDLKNKEIVSVEQRENSNLSNINIKNKHKLVKLNMETDNTILSFKNEYDAFISESAN